MNKENQPSTPTQPACKPVETPPQDRAMKSPRHRGRASSADILPPPPKKP